MTADVAAPNSSAVPGSRFSQFLRWTVWQTLATLIARGVVVAAVLVMARRLPFDAFGEISTVRSTVALLATLAASGIGIVASKYLGRWLSTELARCHGLVGFALGTAALFGFALSVSFFVLSPWLATLLDNAALAAALKIAAVLVFCEALTSVFIGLFVGLGETRRFAVASALGALPYLPIVFFATGNGSLTTALLGLVVAELVLLVVRAEALYRTLRRHRISPRWTFGADERAMLWHTGLPALLNGLAAVPFLWVGVLMLVRSPDGYAQMALYGAAMPWFSFLLFVPNQIAAVFLPSLAQGHGLRNNAAMRSDFALGLRMVIAAAAPALPVMLLAPWILSFYGADYVAAAPVLVAVAAAAIVAATQNLLTNLLAAIDRLWIAVAFSLVWCLVYLVTAAILVDRAWGALALAVALFIAYFTKLLLLAGYGARRAWRDGAS